MYTKKILNAAAGPIVLPSRDTSHTLVQILLLHRRQHCREGKKSVDAFQYNLCVDHHFSSRYSFIGINNDSIFKFNRKDINVKKTNPLHRHLSHSRHRRPRTTGGRVRTPRRSHRSGIRNCCHSGSAICRCRRCCGRYSGSRWFACSRIHNGRRCATGKARSYGDSRHSDLRCGDAFSHRQNSSSCHPDYDHHLDARRRHGHDSDPAGIRLRTRSGHRAACGSDTSRWAITARKPVHLSPKVNVISP